jgi:hypothetical protein
MAPYVERLAPDVIFLPGNFHFPLVPALAGARTRGAGGQDLEPGGAFRAGGSAGALAVPPLSHSIDGLAAMNSGLEREIRAIAPDFNVTTLYDPVYLEDTPHPLPRAPRTGWRSWAGRFEPQKDAAGAAHAGGAEPHHPCADDDAGRRLAAAGCRSWPQGWGWMGRHW